MEFNVKKLTDEEGEVWIAIYDFLGINEPLALIRGYEADCLATQIFVALNKNFVAVKKNGSEIRKKDTEAEG